MRAIISMINVVFVFGFKTLEYSQAFSLMAAVLLVSSPLLYLYVPEIRNIGSDMAAEFFLPSQTIFYFLPPQINRKYRNKKAMKNWTLQLDGDEVETDQLFENKNQDRIHFVSNILSQFNPLM